MTDLVASIPDTFIVLGAVAFAVRSLQYSKSLKSGYYSQNFLIVGIAAILLAIAELGHLASDAGIYPMGELIHDIIEAAFVVVLAIGITKFFPSWMPKG